MLEENNNKQGMNNIEVQNVESSPEPRALPTSFTAKLYQFVHQHSSFVPTALPLVSAVIISTLLYPLGTMEQAIQVGAVTGMRNLPQALKYLQGEMNLTSFGHANKASICKNTTIGSKETVVKEVQSSAHEDDSMLAPYSPSKPSFKVLALASFLIGLLDTTATNYFSNMRIISSAARNSPIIPFYAQDAFKWKQPTLSELFISALRKMDVWQKGALLRYSRNTGNAFFCLATSEIKAGLDAVLPEQLQAYNKSLSIITAGILGGTCTNMLEILYKTQIRNINLETGATDSLNATIRDIYRKFGWKAPFKGLPFSITSTILAYTVINTLNESAQELIKNSNSYAIEQNRPPVVDRKFMQKLSFFCSKEALTQAFNKPLSEADSQLIIQHGMPAF